MRTRHELQVIIKKMATTAKLALNFYGNIDEDHDDLIARLQCAINDEVHAHWQNS